MAENKFKAAVYIRLSREDGDKDESDSVANQRKLLTEYVDRKEDLILYDMYIDDGYSGINFNRPGFRKMMEDIEEGRINCVIVKDLSRFGRDYIDTGRYLERYFPEMGVRFISVSDNIDSRKQAYDMLLPIKNIFNEQYARDISRKVQTTVKAKQKAGDFIGAFASYGYKKSPANKNKLIIDEYAASVVRRIFSLYIQGCGKIKIAKILNEEGILCPAEYKAVNGENYRNCNRLDSTTYWSYSTIHNILNKEIYAGNMVQGKFHQRMRSKSKRMPREDWVVVENTHEPIIDRETWDKAQALLKKRTRDIDLNANLNIFAGFVKCGDCGRAMAKTMHRRTDGRKAYYLYCGTYKRNGTSFCTAHALPLEVLEKIVLDDLKAIIASMDNLKELARMNSYAVGRIQRNTESELFKMKTELERIKKRKRSIYEDYKEELISKEEYLSYREEYQKKEDLYSRQIETLQKKKSGNEDDDVSETPWLKRLLELRDIEALDRDIIVEMVSEITVYENRRIRIVYNFSNDLEDLFPKMSGAHTYMCS